MQWMISLFQHLDETLLSGPNIRGHPLCWTLNAVEKDGMHLRIGKRSKLCRIPKY
jgi:hypothetical protein